ncbi:hypothetical protein SYYSPA8_24500 [Streptomyces yaizuensis]|uniref:ScoMcrA-like DNA sulfur-binding domain-containing protein n=1 Tax=Streptomyces yaizuensis TaxID=2989713 RepID=A0ABQ5P4J7_9ACTN|nr:hypothetical protein SYYSPA8_24500 [Streptomyces sp. YSPA8]
MAVLDLSAEDHRVDWSWTEARGNRDLSAADALERAPRSWHSRHKPLTLLWGISKIAGGQPRLAPWHQFREEAAELLAEFGHPFGHPDSSVTPEYPFWHLRTSRLWDVYGIPPEQEPRSLASTFDRLDPEGGMTEQAARLLDDPAVRAGAVAALREVYLADVDHAALMERLGLTGYDSASGAPDAFAQGAGEETGEERAGTTGPASRRRTEVSRIDGDAGLAAGVKRLHGDRCQVCGLRQGPELTPPGDAERPRSAETLTGAVLIAWRRQDSNLGRLSRRIYSPLPLATRAHRHGMVPPGWRSTCRWRSLATT